MLTDQELERAARYRARQEREKAERRDAGTKMASMSPGERALVGDMFNGLKYLLSMVPRTYRGPYATAADVVSVESVNAYLIRNGLMKAPTP